MINSIVIILIVVASLWNCRKCVDAQTLSIQQGSCVKGLAALLLIPVHIGNSMQQPGAAYKFMSSVGFLLVAIFFFYSGYGTAKKSIRDPEYFKRKIPKRIIYLIKMMIITETVYLLVESFVMKKKFTMWQVAQALLGIKLLNGAMWYIIAMIIMLICYYPIVMLLHDGKNNGGYTAAAAISAVIYIVLTAMRKHGAWEMQSCIAFVLGTVVAENENVAKNFLKKKKIAAINIIVLAISFVEPYIIRKIWEDNIVARVFFGSIASVTFVCVVLFFLSYFEMENSFIRAAGKLSTEIYLSHQLIINLYHFYVPKAFDKTQVVVLSVLIIITTVIISGLVHEIEKKVTEAAKILDIEHLLKRKPKALSGGQRQRVALGRAIVRNPKVFLMDEPLSNLDAKLRVQMRTEISKLYRKLQTTFIYVTHDQVEAMTMGTRIVVMKDGVIQQVDTPQNIYNYPTNLFVAGFMGSPQMNFIDGVIEKSGNDLFASFNGNKIKFPADKCDALKSYIGKEVTFGIRPQSLSDDKELIANNPHSTIVGDIEVVEHMGAESYVYTKCGNASVTIRIEGTTNLKVGEKAKIYLDANSLHVFDKDTTLRVI